jgi:HEAT repeat protein
MARRRALAARTGPELWTTLLRLGARHGPNGPLDSRPGDDAGALVAALLARDDVPEGALLAALDDPRMQASWIGGHLFELAARRRLRTAVPRFVAALGGEGAHAAAVRGLGLLGDARAVALLAALFPRRERAFRIDAAEALGRIPLPASESALVRLLGAEPDDDVRAALCVALCRLFSIAGLEVVRGELATARSPLRLRLDGNGEPVDVAGELAVAALVVDDALAERSRRRLAAAG